MPTTPTWQNPVAGQAPLAAHQTQLLGSHASKLFYTGVQTAAQTTAGTGSTSSNGTYAAQSFTTSAGQTAIGYILLQMNATIGAGASLGPLTIQLRTNNAGAPSSTILATVTASTEYVFNAPASVHFPLNATGLTASTQYWIVTLPAGNASFSYTWGKSNQTSGTSTSSNGTTWAAQTYGSIYQVWDQTVSGKLQHEWDDGGARWTWYSYLGNGQVTQFAEYTAGQTAAGYLQSFRNYAYSNGLPVSIT